MADQPETIERDIAETRRHLSRTVEELSRRADVGERARQAVGSSPRQAATSALQSIARHQGIAAGLGGGTVALTALAAWRHGRADGR